MNEYISIGKAAEILGVNVVTLRRWEEKGLITSERTPTGFRRYKVSQIEEFKLNRSDVTQNKTYLYARVSTQKQAESGNLARQIVRLTDFAIKNKLQITDIFQDIASGLNENRRGLKNLLNAVKENKNCTVIVEYKDRLARFGFSYLEQYIQDFGGKIMIVESQEINAEQELVEDLIAITTSFSARIYGKRGGRVAKKIEQVLEEESKFNENDDSRLPV